MHGGRQFFCDPGHLSLSSTTCVHAVKAHTATRENPACCSFLLFNHLIDDWPCLGLAFKFEAALSFKLGEEEYPVQVPMH